MRRRSVCDCETDGVVAVVIRIPESHPEWWRISTWLQMGSRIVYVVTGDSAQVNSASRTSIVSICDVGDESSSVAPMIVAQFVECGATEYIQTILRFLTFMVS